MHNDNNIEAEEQEIIHKHRCIMYIAYVNDG